MTLLEVAKQALEAMEDAMYRADTHEFYDAKESLRYAIEQAEQAEQAEQEPVAWMDIDDNGQRLTVRQWSDGNSDEVPLYTAPTPRKPLTDEEIVRICVECWRVSPRDIFFARAIERAHGIGEQT